MFSSAREFFYSALFPSRCLCCNGRLTTIFNGNACTECWDETLIFAGGEPTCTKCGKPAPIGSKTISTQCWQCDGHHYCTARSAGIYSHALASAVVGLKTEPKLSKRVETLIMDAFERNGFAKTTLIIPVPLSKQRAFERGFNQSEVIARSVGRRASISVDTQSLARTKHSPIHRAGMDQKARDLSVRNSFEVIRPKLVVDQTILLVDDVLTTGATVSYCAKALNSAGAKEVNVLTLARAV